MMPDMDGPTTFRHLQADEATRDIPVILLTAKVQVGDRQVWDDLAVAGVIPKPFDPMQLTTEVAEMLNWDDLSHDRRSRPLLDVPRMRRCHTTASSPSSRPAAPAAGWTC